MSRDMTGRIEPIYSALIVQPGIPGPAGLTFHGFSEKSGYLDELLVTGKRGGVTDYAARCLAGDAADRSIAPCERDIHVGDDLSVTYRFPKELLDQWRQLDQAVLAKVNSFMRPPR